jgi:Rab GDP dissociation inhibitor
MTKLYAKFGLEAGTQDFIGHAMALYLDDKYKNEVAAPTIKRIKLYAESMVRYGKSPYIYPLFGLGELPQSFARLSAIYGGTYMLSKKIDSVNFDDEGKFTSVTSEGETVKAKLVVGDPSYFGAGQELGEGGKLRVNEIGKVVRAICILKHPVPGTDDSDSCQIVIPQGQVNRKNGKISLKRPQLTARHLHCGRVRQPRCCSQGLLHCDRLYDRRDLGPRARAHPWSSAYRQRCRQVCHH